MNVPNHRNHTRDLQVTILTLLIVGTFIAGLSEANQSTETKDSSQTLYIVRSGDTMWDIARAHGITVSTIRKANSIGRGSRIYVGQKLIIPTRKSRIPTIRKTSEKALVDDVTNQTQMLDTMIGK